MTVFGRQHKRTKPHWSGDPHVRQDDKRFDREDATGEVDATGKRLKVDHRRKRFVLEMTETAQWIDATPGGFREYVRTYVYVNRYATAKARTDARGRFERNVRTSRRVSWTRTFREYED